jgi:hypothetical protein
MRQAVPAKKPALRVRHWVMLVSLVVATAQFYFVTVLLDYYSAPRMVVFASTSLPEPR